MITFTAKLTVKAGHEGEFESAMRDVVPRVRAEPGNHAYDFHRSTEDARVFMFYEQYTDEDALKAHRRHLKEMGIDLRAILDGTPQLEFYEKIL